MNRLEASNHFKRSLKKLTPIDQEKTASCLKKFLEYLETGEMPAGVGFKKIGNSQYEIRLDIRLRIAIKLEKDIFVCHIIGNHEAIESYLKEYRNK